MLNHELTPRVGFIMDSHDPSGVGEHLLSLAPRLVQRGYAVHLVCRSAPGLERFRQRWISLGLGLSTLPRPRADTPATFRRLVTHLRSLQLDIAHLQLGISWEIGRIPQAAAEAGIPIRLSTEHLPYLLDDPFEIEAHRTGCAVLDTVVTVSDGVRESFLAQQLPASLFRTIHNGIDVGRFSQRPSQQEARCHFNLPHDAPVVLTVARFTEQKGHCYLIEAAKQVLRVMPETRFLLAGHGPLRQDIQTMAIQTGVSQRMHFLRRRRDIRLLMAAADLLVLSSVYEGHPLVVLEAMAAGLPVLGTRVCGTSETVEHGVSGWLVPAEDATALAEAMLLLSAPEQRYQLAQAAQERVMACFTADRMADDVDDLYTQLLATRLPFKLPMATSPIMERV